MKISLIPKEDFSIFLGACFLLLLALGSKISGIGTTHDHEASLDGHTGAAFHDRSAYSPCSPTGKNPSVGYSCMNNNTARK